MLAISLPVHPPRYYLHTNIGYSAVSPIVFPPLNCGTGNEYYLLGGPTWPLLVGDNTTVCAFERVSYRSPVCNRRTMVHGPRVPSLSSLSRRFTRSPADSSTILYDCLVPKPAVAPATL